MSGDAGKDPERARLDALQKRIDRLRGTQAPPRRADEHYSQAHIAWRMVIELVSGLGVGFAIGLGLDALFGTRPWLLIVFTLLGFAAGVRVMMRTAAEIGADGRTAPPERTERDERRAGRSAGDEGD